MGEPRPDPNPDQHPHRSRGQGRPLRHDRTCSGPLSTDRRRRGPGGETSMTGEGSAGASDGFVVIPAELVHAAGRIGGLVDSLAGIVQPPAPATDEGPDPIPPGWHAEAEQNWRADAGRALAALRAASPALGATAAAYRAADGDAVAALRRGVGQPNPRGDRHDTPTADDP